MEGVVRARGKHPCVHQPGWVGARPSFQPSTSSHQHWGLGGLLPLLQAPDSSSVEQGREN